MKLALKYKLTIDLHEHSVGYEWDIQQLYSRLAREYHDVPMVYCHGGGHDEISIKRACWVTGRNSNIYLETGAWAAEQYIITFDDTNIRPTQLIWGHDYGNVPQYLTRCPGKDSKAAGPPYFMKRWLPVLTYQTDWWGWSLRQIRGLKDW